MQTEDKESIRHYKITFHTKEQRYPSLSVALNPPHISQTCRHPHYRTAHVCQFARYNKPTFLYFLAVGSL